MKRLLDHNPLTGLNTWFDYDDTTDTTIIEYEQDVQPIIDANKAAANDANGRLGEMVRVASIPASIQMKWLVEKGVDVLNPEHRGAVAKLLDDPDWRYLKCREIILGGY